MNVGFDVDELIAPGAALQRFFDCVKLGTLQREYVAIDDALTRTLSDDICADRDYPDAARSAMDGFALQATENMHGCEYLIVGEVPMGGTYSQRLVSDSCVRIPTGGVLPLGATAVLPIEEVVEREGRIRCQAQLSDGDNVTQRGEDMQSGARMLGAGHRIGVADVGLLATLGIVDVPVRRRPVFGVLSSGDELIEPACVPRPGQIRDSNRFAIAAALRAMGADAVHLPSVSDEAGALERSMREALPGLDGLVLSGGSSVGERDRTPDAIAALGKPGVIVHGLKIKPGKPTVLAALGEKPILGLPGNPASALMVLDVVGWPLIASMLGAVPNRRLRVARLAMAVDGRPGWTWYLPVRVEHEPEGLVAHPVALRSSHVSLMARASGYVTVAAPQEAGELVDVLDFIGGS